MDKIQEFINALTKEVGYHESGGYNHNKFAEFIDKNYPNWYNAPKQGMPWCCIFIHAIAIQTFGYNNVLKIFGLPEHNSGAGCEGCANGYRNINRRVKGKDNLQVGDQVIFGAYSYDHTGIIYQVIDANKGIYLCIEGNYMDSVQFVRRTYGEMIFVGRPLWEEIT